MEKMNLSESINRIRTLCGLNELRVEPKDQLGAGDFHVTYPMRDPNKVVKAGWDFQRDENGEAQDYKLAPFDPKHMEVFQKFPDLFPKVYKVDPKGTYIVLEKLDTATVERENEELGRELERIDGEETPDALGVIYDTTTVDMAPVIDLDQVQNQALLKKYLDFFYIVNSNLTPDVIGKPAVDLHGGQIGYDKEGRLKLLDF